MATDGGRGQEGARWESGDQGEKEGRQGILVKNKEMSGSDGRRFCGTEASGVIFFFLE